MSAPNSRAGGGPRIGIGRVFGDGDRAAEQIGAALETAGAADLRLVLGADAWADSGARRRLAGLLTALAGRAQVLPSLTADLTRERLDDFIESYGARFEWVELRARTHAWAVDDDSITALSAAARYLRECGKRVVLSAPLLELHRLIEHPDIGFAFDAFGICADPLAEAGGPGRAQALDALRARIEGTGAELWVSELGLESHRLEPRRQIESLLEVAVAPIRRLYFESQPAHTADAPPVTGAGTLLSRLLASGGLGAAVELLRRARPMRSAGYTVITGGAGFIGCNLADRLLSDGEAVLIYDNLSRPGTEKNLRWLCDKHGAAVGFTLADVRDRRALGEALRGAERVFHFAAQVAVTTSLDAPVFDHEINAGGTLFLLEALRALGRPVPLVFTSTNKVYGGLHDVALQTGESRYEPVEEAVREQGIGENRPLQFRSPYGCSKGVADQYALDYADTFGLPATVLRMSCIYGPHQFGNEDQGWVAHFVRQALADRTITLYGDGLQVRDVLYIDDLVEALLLAASNSAATSGRAFNIGGGPHNVLSLRELLAVIANVRGMPPRSVNEDWRPSDQRWYVSDVRAFGRVTGWAPRVGVQEGVTRLIAWMEQNAHTDSMTARPAASHIAQAEVGS